ncbi:MAG: superoxide dismutase [Myxococcales bacterium]|nr:superoxide dismutase [Myxococcales bacterium]
MAHELPALPWSKDALAPHMSAETLDYHHGKHHNAYVTKLNAAIAGTAYEGLSLEECVRKSAAEGNKAVFNNAAQHFNHSFFWKCLSPNGGGAPTGKALDAIQGAFGDVEAFKLAFTTEAANHFGSGWAWLIRDANGTIRVTSTHDADSPVAHGHTPLLTIDVWEHAYYVDYRNARPSFIDAFWKMVNWDFLAENLG